MTCVLVSPEIGGVPVDLILARDHTSNMTIAQHPVENGAPMSDHAWVEPFEVGFSGVITNHGGGHINGLGSRAASAWEALLAVQRSLKPFTIVTGLKAYPNMMIESLSANEDEKSGGSLHFSGMFKQVLRFGGQASSFSGAEQLFCPPTINSGRIEAIKPQAGLGQGGLITGSRLKYIEETMKGY
jgi:hypothetical protein